MELYARLAAEHGTLLGLACTTCGIAALSLAKLEPSRIAVSDPDCCNGGLDLVHARPEPHENIASGLGLRNLGAKPDHFGGCGGGLHLALWKYRTQQDDYRYDMRPMAKGAKVFYFKNQVWDNMFWTLGPALAFWTFWECLMWYAYANGWATMITFQSNPVWFVALIVLIPIWAGLHFYWLHRLLHVGKLYTWFHSWHHKNINTGPWSGLAMHPVESFFLMFDTMIFFLLPAHPVHVLFLLLHHGIGAPTSHAGFENIKLGKVGKFALGDFFHQLHHKFFDCNYGTWETPWDRWFNTFHDGTADGNELVKERRRKIWLTK